MKPNSHWREQVRPIIQKVIRLFAPLNDEKLLRRKLREAYPFEMRKYHPYKIWLSEVKAQLDAYYGRPSKNLHKTRSKKKRQEVKALADHPRLF